MKRNLFAKIAFALIAMLLPFGVMASSHDDSEKKEGIDAQGIIFEHLGDGYGWEVPFNHHKRIPLPVIVWGSDGLQFSLRRVSPAVRYIVTVMPNLKLPAKIATIKEKWSKSLMARR